MSMSDFLDQQKREALGPVNKWYCSQYYGFEINDPEKLLAYYIKHGGAYHFRKRHSGADEQSAPTQKSA